jgi:hypothetical protein
LDIMTYYDIIMTLYDFIIDNITLFFPLILWNRIFAFFAFFAF